jgi:hypothetical protein
MPRLGRLILAAPPSSAEVTLATYKDIHLRGLSLIGVPWAGGTPASDSGLSALAQEVLANITRHQLGEPTPRCLLHAVNEDSGR